MSHLNTVRSGSTGSEILCCWWDCDRKGFYNFLHRHLEGERWVTYLFCSERHRALWRHSKHSHGNLPVGSRGMIG